MDSVDGYVRVSRVAGREGERFISPEEQLRAIEGWAKLHKRSVGEVFTDLDQSGKKRHRPGLDAAIDRVKAGQSEGIIVAKLDRFGRSVSHLGELLDILAEHDAALFTVAEGIDTSGRAGRMIASIMSAVAEFEVHRQGESWLVARMNAVERGVFVGGTVPLGYVKDATGRLSVGPEAPIVRQAFARRAAGQSWGHVADWIAGETTGAWSVGALRYLIRNRTYLGEIHGGPGIVNLTGHEPLIDRATFEAANTVTGHAPASSGRASGPLSGLLRCASCRYALKVNMRVGGARDYACKTGRRENAARCEAPVSISAKSVEPVVIERFFAEVETLRAYNLKNAGGVQDALDLLTEAESERDAALDGRLRDVIDTDAFHRIVSERQAAVDRARERVAVARSRSATLPDTNVHELWPDLTLLEQRHLLTATFDAVFVRRGRGNDRLYVCERGSGVSLPTRGKRWQPVPFHFPA
jgi:site-specific DNA recombinase